jgi:hypothetical protein
MTLTASAGPEEPTPLVGSAYPAELLDDESEE